MENTLALRRLMILKEKCLSLPAIHALSGCDSVSYPFGKGKITAVNLMNDSTLVLLLQKLGNVNCDIGEVLESGKAFFMRLYGGKKLTQLTINQLRYKLFTKRTDKTPKIKTLPPTEDALKHHILRPHLQVMLWEAADSRDPPQISWDIEQFGWNLINDIPQPVTTLAKYAPDELLKLVSCSCGTSRPCARKSCSYVSSGVTCTGYCNCEGASNCNNIYTQDLDQNEINSSSHK